MVQRAEKFSVRLPVVGRVAVPPPDQLAFYGVLGVLAGVGLVDWPVAVAIGVGQAVVARHFTDQHAGAEPSRPPEREIPAASPAAAPRKSTPRKSTAGRTSAKKATANKAATSRQA